MEMPHGCGLALLCDAEVTLIEGVKSRVAEERYTA